MKIRHVVYVLAGLVATSFVSSFLNEAPAPARSPKQIYPAYTQAEGMCGTGHAFGFGLAYTVTEHKAHNGKMHAVIKSDEPGVEICSPIPQLVAMMDGTKFHVIKASNIDEAIQRIPLRNK